MKNKFIDYSCGFRIVSVAKDNATKDDLCHNGLDTVFVDKNKVVILPENIVLSQDKAIVDVFAAANNYDAFELWPDGQFFRRYDNSSIDNYFFVTARCNSNCVMCPSPATVRRMGGETDIASLIEMAKHIPISTQHLTVTGGEPFLAGKALFSFFAFLRDKFEYTEFLILTNGRVFSIKEYAMLMRENMPYNTIIAIPLHGASADIHDAITQANNSFMQTIIGIKNLLSLGIRVELRIVVNKLNIQDIPNIVELIINELPNIAYVSVIAMEMTGNARLNRELVWITYRQSFKTIESSVLKLINAGIDVKLYNFPLCTVKQRFWPICEKSISPEKVRYAEVCDECAMKALCGGVFAGTYSMEKEELRAIT